MRHILLAASLSIAGCSASVSAVDAGACDSGARDAGPIDAGPTDAGPDDAGPPDSGAPCIPPGLSAISGSLASYLAAVPIAASGSEGFIAPSTAELDAFQAAFSALLDGDVAAAAPALDALGFDVDAFTDDAGGTFLLVVERQPGRGGGTFVVNPNPARPLWLEATHHGYEPGTLLEGAAALVRLGAAGLFITGSHRCADAASAPCLGSTDVCGGEFKISDSAHFEEQFFTAAHRAMRAHFPASLAVSLHGMSPCCGELATISDGTTVARASSISIAFRAALNARLPPDAGLGYSCNDPNDDGLYKPLCGTTDVQAMIDDGSTRVCQRVATSANDTFLHVEQAPALRQSPGAAVSFDAVVEALGAIVPCASGAGGGEGCTIPGSGCR